MQRDALGAEALDLEEFERGGRELLQQQVAPFAGAVVDDLRQHTARPLPMPGMSVTLRSESRRMSAMRSGIAFDSGGAIAIAANAKRVFGGDLHQIGRLPKYARDFLILQICLVLNCSLDGRRRCDLLPEPCVRYAKSSITL